MCEIWGRGEEAYAGGSPRSPTAHATHAAAQPRNPTAPQRTQRTQKRPGPHGPGRPGSNKSYRFQRSALGRNMKGERISVEPRPTLKPPITSVTQWTPRYRRVTQINTMKTTAATHSR